MEEHFAKKHLVVEEFPSTRLSRMVERNKIPDAEGMLSCNSSLIMHGFPETSNSDLMDDFWSKTESMTNLGILNDKGWLN